MTTLSYVLPATGQLNSTEDPKIVTALQAILNWANGSIDAVNLSAALAQAASVNQAGQIEKGAVNIAASETRTNVAYGTMPTPDQVTGIVLPTNGLIMVGYQAAWQNSAAGAGSAGLFLGANQVQSGQSSSLITVGTTGPNTINANTLLATSMSQGLVGNGATGYPGDATTGQLLGYGGGGPAIMFAAAGTYTVSVQFKASSGSVTASNRKLWVLAFSFA